MAIWRAFIDHLVVALKRIGGLALVGMMLLTCFDVAFRAFGTPIFGAVEIVSFMATILLACAMPQTHQENGHVGVDLFIRKLKPQTQAVVDSVTNVVAALLFGLVCWRMIIYAGTMRKSGEVSMTLEFPAYILVYVVSVAFGVLALVIATGAVYKIKEAVAHE